MEFVSKNCLTKKFYALFTMLVNSSKHLRNNYCQLHINLSREQIQRGYLIGHSIHLVKF